MIPLCVGHPTTYNQITKISEKYFYGHYFTFNQKFNNQSVSNKIDLISNNNYNMHIKVRDRSTKQIYKSKNST